MTGRHAQRRGRAAEERAPAAGRHVARRGVAQREFGALQHLRHGFASGRGTAVLLAVIAAVTTAFLVAVPQLASGAQDRGMGDAVRSVGSTERDLALRLTPRAVEGVALPSSTLGARSAPPFTTVDEAVARAMDRRTERLFGAPRHTAQSDPFVVVQKRGTTLSVSLVEVVLRLDDVVTSGVRWTAGGAPGPPTATRTITTPTGQEHTVSVVPMALSARTAQAWGVGVGDVLELTPSPDALRRVTPTVVSISGTYEPLDPTTDEWATEPRLLGIAKIPFGQGETKDQAALVAPLSGYAAVADGIWRIPRGESPTPSPALDHAWRYRLDDERLVRSDAALVRRLLVGLQTDAVVWSGVPEPPQVVTGLSRLLDRYDRDVAVTAVMTAFVTGGITALSVLVLGLTALVGAERRSLAEVRLLRIRGASTPLVLGLVAVWTAALGVPAVVLAGVATALVLPGPVPRGTLVEVALVVLLPLVAAVVATWRRVRGLEEVPDETRDLGRAARRVVLEAVLVALAASAVTTVRSRGDVIAAGRTDWFAVVTPVLVALAAAVVAIRVLPWPVGLLARLAARGRGLVAYLGLTRAARTGASSAVPITALVVGTTLVALMSTLSATVDTQRDLAAHRAVGADARVDAARIDPADLAGLAAREGVGAALPALIDRSGGVVVGQRETLVTVLAVDPVAYEKALRGTPIEVDLPTLTPEGDTLPVVLSGGPDADRLDLVVRGTTLPARRVATVPGLVRALGGREGVVALVPLDALRAVSPATQPNTVLLQASSATQRSLADAARTDRTALGGLVTGVVTVDGQRGAVSDRALARFVTGSYLAGTVLAGALTLLALLLLLATTRPARTQLVIRLRTLGLPHGAERRLAWTEVMPLLVLGVAAGVVAGVLAPVAVSAALDLAPVTGAVTRLPIEPRPLAGALAGFGVLVLGALALLIDAVSARHGDLAQHLRRGDSA